MESAIAAAQRSGISRGATCAPSAACHGWAALIPKSYSTLIWNLGLDKFRQKSERFLPAEIASLGGNDIGYPFLHNVQFGPYGHLLQGYRHLNFPWQVRIIEFVRVANAFVRHQFEILSAEGVAMPCGEIRERHLVGAADLGIQVVNLASESVWRKPFGHCIGIQERPIDSLRRRTEHAVKPDGVC